MYIYIYSSRYSIVILVLVCEGQEMPSATVTCVCVWGRRCCRLATSCCRRRSFVLRRKRPSWLPHVTTSIASKRPNYICTHMHTYIHTYIHTCINMLCIHLIYIYRDRDRYRYRYRYRYSRGDVLNSAAPVHLICVCVCVCVCVCMTGDGGSGAAAIALLQALLQPRRQTAGADHKSRKDNRGGTNHSISFIHINVSSY